MQIETVARCSASRVTEERKKGRKKDEKKKNERVLALIAAHLSCATKKNFLDLHVLLGDFVLKVVLLPLESVDPLMILGQSGLHASC